MKHSQSIRSISSFGLLMTSVLTGCALNSQPEPGDEAIGSTSQASTVVPGDKGFVWSNNATGSFNAVPSFSYNSSGGTNHITQTTTGSYNVDFPGLGSVVGGDVQVTAYGSGSERCKTNGWQSIGSTLRVLVSCFDTTGAFVNTLFTASYIRRSDQPGADTAYVLAGIPSSPSYNTTGSPYSWNSAAAGGAAITHTPGTGSYVVTLAGQNMSGGTVEVTALGVSSEYCKVAGWGGNIINVACFNGATGQPAESIFTVLFSSKSPNSTPSSTYAWANQPSSASYHPSATYELGLLNVDTNSSPIVVPTPATITRSSPGRYLVQFPSMASIVSTPSNVKVTGYLNSSDTCKVVGWFPSGADAFVNVACFSATGTPVDAYYTITYSSFAYTIG